MENIHEANASYEAWLTEQLGEGGDPQSFDTKHRLMAKEEFPFFRATFYRWAQLWHEEADELSTPSTPHILSVGDLHVENFGTWRDDEGRLVWGVNDFDEACELAWTSDLVRLATSTLLASKAGSIPINERELCARICAGYRGQLQLGLKDEARPFILAEKNPELGKLMRAARNKPDDFWWELRKVKSVEVDFNSVPASASAAIKIAMHDRNYDSAEWRTINPDKKVDPPGMGSIGRRRYYAVKKWGGAWMAREAKALAPSANAWATKNPSKIIHIATLIDSAVRCKDPFFHYLGGWMVRRLAPDAVKAKFKDVEKDEVMDKGAARKLFEGMGAETANVHLGSGKALAIIEDFDKRKAKNEDWLWDAAKEWEEKLHRDFEDFTRKR